MAVDVSGASSSGEPLDTAAIRAAYSKCNQYGWPADIRALCDLVDALRTENDRLRTWDGLMDLLDEKWPEDIFPTRPDDERRDPGPRIVSLLRRLADVEAERDRLALDVATQAENARLQNQVRHWKEQEAKQRRLHHEKGEWKHRALAAELDAIHAHDAAAVLWGQITAVLALCAATEAFARAKRRETGVLLWDHPKVDVAEVRAALTGDDQAAVARLVAAEAKLAAIYALCQRNFNLEDYYEIDANDVAAIIEGGAALTGDDQAAEVCPPHRYPEDAPGDEIAWRCQRCGEWQRG